MNRLPLLSHPQALLEHLQMEEEKGAEQRKDIYDNKYIQFIIIITWGREHYIWVGGLCLDRFQKWLAAVWRQATSYTNFCFFMYISQGTELCYIHAHIYVD